jgi:hypothetical protein
VGREQFTAKIAKGAKEFDEPAQIRIARTSARANVASVDCSLASESRTSEPDARDVEVQVLRTTLDEGLAGNEIEQGQSPDVRELLAPFCVGDDRRVAPPCTD